MRKKILILCWNYFPQGINLAIVLYRNGFDVTYCSNSKPSTFIDIPKEIKISSVPSLIFNKFPRIITLVNWIYMLAISVKGFDIVIGFNELGFVQAAALKFAKRAKLAVGYFLEYNSPKTNPDSFSVNLSARLAKYCDVMVDVEENRLSMRKSWMGYKGPSFMIRNVPILFNNNNRNTNVNTDNLIVLYQGLISPANNIEKIIDGIIGCDFPIKLKLVGNADHEYFENIKKIYQPYFLSKKVEYLGSFDRKKLSNVISECDMGVVFYSKQGLTNFIYCAPNKLYEYISHGVPVICSDHKSLNFVTENKVGIQVDINNPQNLSGALKKLYLNKEELTSMKTKCIDIFRQEFNYEVESAVFVKFLNNTIYIN